jgi:hypothetical protein
MAGHETFGHIRLYTRLEVEQHFRKFGFSLERCVLESANSENRGRGPRSLHRRLYRFYERVESKFNFLRKIGVTWYMVFRKTP